MSFENYYENMDETNEPKPPRRAGRIALLVVSVAVVFLIIGMLLAGLIQSAQQPWQPLLPEQPEKTQSPEPDQSAQPAAPTPLPTERPMVTLDGVAPMLPSTGNPIPDIVDAVAPSVVGVLNYSGDTLDEGTEQGMGSGFIVSSEGYILTNAHVVAGAGALAVTLMDGTEVEAQLIGSDTISDVAVLKVDYAGLRPLKLGDSGYIRVGDYVVAVGNPLGFGLEGTVTMGIISARSRTITIDDHTNTYIQTDAAINVGNSGGPLLNMRGEVIGINSAKTINAGYDEYGDVISAEGLGFALPINDVRAITEQLITKGYVERAALGVNIVELSKAQMEEKGLQNGVLVVAVVHNSPADTAGIKPGDIVLSCDGMRIEDKNELSDYVNARPVGSQIELIISRDGQELTIQVDLVDMSTLDYSDVEEMEE